MERPDGEGPRGAQDRFKELWSQALLTVGAAEEEARKLLDRLSELVEIGPEDVQRYRREFAERLRSQRKDLERTVEDGVHRAFGRLRIASRAEVEALHSKLDALSERLEAATRRRKATPKPSERPKAGERG